ncbi:NAD(P)-dependent alcohol dehydrogenase (plasmid) [Deinococcus psychrotolerans]|uniref:NAD(P)-dependent alcohol dehydrogenase n=1 Tax=Deinococcus psychrotolerans TaxID=2489213 RepID=A0A3G8YI71_9DEIO|nr:NAD(P)-dependent alcohol dehydrogenase [Deinococcus psychrotolerans]AZI44645.1 NAD(P)-dependent alcohol dehydrogenase [Deinococcus psychrotolerans]
MTLSSDPQAKTSAPIQAYAAPDKSTPLEPHQITRRAVGPHDIQIEILYSGVCHSDVHQARSEWGPSIYPLVPGHEIVGRITEVGQQVSAFKVGDLAGVGVMVDSCQHCDACEGGEEQYCENSFTPTYNGYERGSKEPTHGGYSTQIVVNDKFVVSIPDNLDLKGVAPLLCAGITTYSPLRHWKIGSGHKVAVVGLGGLGHMGIKFARALGAEVTVFTTSQSKVEDAKRLGAHQVVISSDREAMKTVRNAFDFILSTVPTSHDLAPYLKTLRRGGQLVIVGALEPVGLNGGQLVSHRRSVAGSNIGGVAETQEMLNFCAEHNIVADVEMIDMQDINTAYERMLKNDVKYRFVIDMASLKS